MSTTEIQKKIHPIFKRYGIRRASVFGSVSRGDDTPQSDVDILIAVGVPMGLFTYMKMKREIEKKLGRSVDIVTEKSINKFIEPYVTEELQTIYEG